MRITQVINSLDPAGAERVVSDLSRGLTARGHAVEVVSLMPPPSDDTIPAELAAAGIPVRYLGLLKTAPWKLAGLPEALAASRPDVVHAHLFYSNIASRLANKGRFPLVNTVHNMDLRARRKWFRWVDRATRDRCRVHTAVSRGVQALHAGRIGVPRGRVRVVYNGIRPPDPPSPSRIRELRESWGLDGCALVLGSVGRLVPQKGFAVLLRMLPALAREASGPVGLVILGDGPQKDALRALAAAAPSDLCRIRVPGFREDAPQCIGAFDVLVAPSRYEGFGLMVAEGMALGVPIVASDIEPFREVSAGYANIRFVAFTEVNTGAVGRALAEAKARGGGDRFLPFTVDRMVGEYLALYESLLDRA
jgi:glycosyltransferase involved in cell wall biosynthesis